LKSKKSNLKGWETRWGFFFVAPWILGFLVFNVVPMVASMGFTFLHLDLANPDQQRFVGADNWARALTNDPQVYAGIGRTLLFTLVSLPLSFAFALVMAILLNSRYLLGTKLFRTLFYLPTMVPLVAGVLIWAGILNENTGWINQILQATTGTKVTGPEGVRWLADTHLIYFSYTIIGLWGLGNTILILMAGLQGIPTELHEAAEVDGASWGVRMFQITLPMMTPVIFYNLVTGLIGLMQYFLVPFVLTAGSGFPDGWTNFIMIYFYQQSFSYNNMGYGSVIAWIIFFLGLLFTVFLFGTSKRWVYYAGEKE
jgi:multiple sugar transport system permease protein